MDRRLRTAEEKCNLLDLFKKKRREKKGFIKNGI